jgi:hypothetical protein
MIMLTEGRRAAALREIERHRAPLAQGLRRALAAEDSEAATPWAEGRAEQCCAHVTTERKRAANRRNARLSTGPRTAAGKARVKQNALRHGLNVAVADDPLLTEEVARIARAICDGAGGARPAEPAYLARRIAEAQVDLMRVRRARHAILVRALDNPRYRSPRHLKRQIAMLAGVGELLTRGIAVPDDMRKAAFGRPQGALKFALVITDLAAQLARFDRYERRALSRRKAAVAAFDAACAGRGTPVLIELPAMASPPDREARCWRNKATAGAPGVPAGPVGRNKRQRIAPLHAQEAQCASLIDVVDGCAGRPAKGRRWKSVTVKE